MVCHQQYLIDKAKYESDYEQYLKDQAKYAEDKAKHDKDVADYQQREFAEWKAEQERLKTSKDNNSGKSV